MFDITMTAASTLTHPNPLMTTLPGSFAHNTFKKRIPEIIDEVIARNEFSQDVLSSMIELREEVTHGAIKQLCLPTPDQIFWNLISQEYFGKTWLSVPWYWAESYFYRRMLEACRYFHPGERYLVDPYHAQKWSELQPHAAIRTLEQKLTSLPHESHTRLITMLRNSLWGNRTDLSYNVANTLGSIEQVDDDAANLLVDHSALIVQKLQSNKCRRVAIITDNAGTELLMDLAFTDALISGELVDRVELMLKEQPYFVSDAMVPDVLESISVLSHSPEPLHSLGNRLIEHMNTGRLVLSTHWFFTTCLFYNQMPTDLRSHISSFDLVFLKGDVNYRRLLSDAVWVAETSFVDATDYFPAPLVALRTLKAELIIGLPAGMASRLTQIDPTWMVNGRRGLIQANPA